MRKGIMIVLLLVAAAFAGSATQPGAAEKAPEMVLRVYDVREYLNGLHDYPLPGTPISRPAPRVNVEPTGVSETFWGDLAVSREQKVNELIKMIETVSDPETWSDSGGIGSITEFDGRLYVRQSPDVQAVIEKLIAEISAGADRTVHVSAAWLALTEDQLSALRAAPAAGDDAVIRLDEQALQKATSVARAQLLCLDGQTVHITTGSHQGNIRLQIRPRVMAIKGQVILDVLNRVGDSQEFHTTARIPLGAEVLIGGITAKLSDKDQPMQLYLVIRVDAAE